MQPSNDKKMDESLEGEMGEKVDENMNDAGKTSEESGAKRIKEECICPALGKSIKYLLYLINCNR